jgi:serine/threonine protein phosphatase 1
LIYVIGDIHGMYDPLKILTDFIYDKARQQEPITKVIFLGDYIDCGPASKPVIDLILSLKQDFETVTLLGNHEEHLLSFYNKQFNHIKVGNFWLSYNGGLQTVQSFYPESALFKDTLYPDHKTVAELLFYDDIIRLDPVYENFFNELVISHIIKPDFLGSQVELLFSHSVPSPRHPLDAQLAVQDWKGLHAYMDEFNCELEETILWNRQLLTQQPRDGMTVIHGHTPTRYYRQMTKLLKLWEDEETAPYVGREKKTRKLVQVDIDTGLIYGGSLTMLAIDDTPGAMNLFPYYVSVDPRPGFRHNLFRLKEINLF